MIEELPPSWKDFKSYLKHKKKEMTIEDLILRLRIEDDNPKADHAHINSKETLLNMEPRTIKSVLPPSQNKSPN